MRKVIFLSIIALILILASTIGSADTIAIQTSDGTQIFDGSNPVVVDNRLTVTGDSIKDAKVTINNFTSGDVLGYNASLPSGVSASYDASKGVLSFSGTVNAADWQTLLRTVTFSTSTIGEREITFSIGNAATFEEKEHFYEYIPESLTWIQANEAASNRTLHGLRGYLATITSSDENEFILSILDSGAWIGASDDYTIINSVVSVPYVDQNAAEGHWYWVTGPEAGQKFSTGNITPVTELGQFSNWNSSEPNNNDGDENIASIIATGTVSKGRWNDGAFTHIQHGYVVEYGDMKVDSHITLQDSRTVVISPAPWVSSDSSTDNLVKYMDDLKNIDIASSTSEEIEANMLNVLADIEGEIIQVSDPKVAEEVYDYLGEAIITIGQQMTTVEDPNSIVREISQITDDSRKLISLIDNPTICSDLTVKYFNNMGQIIKTLDALEYESKNLKNKIYQMGDQAVNQTSIYQTPSDVVSIIEESVEVEYLASDIEGHIIRTKEEFAKINNAMQSLLGYSDPRKLKMQLTLFVERPEELNELKIKMENKLLGLLSEEDFLDLSVDMSDASIQFPTSVLSDSEEPLFIHSTFTPNDIVMYEDGRIPVLNGSIADISMEAGNEQVTSFDSLIEIKFDLKKWGIQNFSVDMLNNLCIFVYNEGIGEWEVVGGNYDPVTETIKALRMSLSKYTVMQSQKCFSDVEYSWAKDEINELLGKGILDEEVTFAPESSITRGDFTTWISKAYGLNTEELIIPFEDVLKDNPHFIEISTAYDQGIIKGKYMSSFDPEGYITREEMAMIISNALTKFEDKVYNTEFVGTLEKYSDYNLISDWAKESVLLVDELGILSGDQTFRPNENITREEAAYIIKKIYN